MTPFHPLLAEKHDLASAVDLALPDVLKQPAGKIWCLPIDHVPSVTELRVLRDENRRVSVGAVCADGDLVVAHQDKRVRAGLGDRLAAAVCDGW